MRAAQRLMYTGQLMPYLSFTTASAVAPMGGMMPRAYARAMGARMITTITTAAT